MFNKLNLFLGNISLHNDDLSTESPPSYNQVSLNRLWTFQKDRTNKTLSNLLNLYFYLIIFQLNYNENLTRFFNSQPRTLSEKEAGDGAEKDDYKPYSSGNVGESRFDIYFCLNEQKYSFTPKNYFYIYKY